MDDTTPLPTELSRVPFYTAALQEIADSTKVDRCSGADVMTDEMSMWNYMD